MSLISFGVLEYRIYKFALQVTHPIEKLTEYTREYKKAKTKADQEVVKNKIKKDPMFKRTIELIDYDNLVKK